MKTPTTIDEYLETQPKEFQAALQKLRKYIKKIVPKSEEYIGRGMPCFKINGKGFAGFAGFKKHMSFFPMSGSTFDFFSKELQEFTHTKSSLHFTVDHSVPESLVKKIIEKRLEEIANP